MSDERREAARAEINRVVNEFADVFLTDEEKADWCIITPATRMLNRKPVR